VEGLVILGCDFPEPGEEVPGNTDEVVVLVVVSDVEGEGVDDAVIGICLLRRVYGPVLSNPPCAKGMQKQTDAQQRRKKEEND